MSLQTEIIKKLGVQPTIDPENAIRESIEFMKDYLKAHPFIKTFVLGISGGQDSTLVGRLAQLAMEEMRQETNDSDYYFIAVRLPYGKQNDEEDAKRAMAFINADSQIVVDIKPAVDAQVAELTAIGIDVTDYNKGNIKARQRMVTQYAIAGAYQGAVLGTDHAAENLTGFFTKFGDGAADLIPIATLNKRQGREVLKALEAPASLYLKVPVADLEENRPMIADETVLGVSYSDIDDYLEGKTVSKEAQETIENWWKKGEHKRHLPITMKDDFWK
ncbi:ammonia-dependent NAD(+) synthetase [Enterococcus alcedinis]|uniref:NH(3)-dependent NAD(+) synthetase n=1 Tax=Enterococcus alcedinis TaxID=1274384 RepID=A0A917JGV0_9ENTE|nr:ammonia-dependent NAD(+) synthetase [Enterococcus alcedinis]MBP2101908.1 NAD+ synthase [Enterococcus alcedinis]GGI65471.1 NH(3)-dependent NAD(+) synthetase [Enterococcus alcedinis]